MPRRHLENHRLQLVGELLCGDGRHNGVDGGGNKALEEAAPAVRAIEVLHCGAKTIGGWEFETARRRAEGLRG